MQLALGINLDALEQDVAVLLHDQNRFRRRLVAVLVLTAADFDDELVADLDRVLLADIGIEFVYRH